MTIKVNYEKDSKNDFNQVYVLETKGLHLMGNKDTNYKKKVFILINESLSNTISLCYLGIEFIPDGIIQANTASYFFLTL